MTTTPQTLTPAQALARLRDIEKAQLDHDGGGPGFDTEAAHLEGDAILRALIRHLGRPEVADLHTALAEHWWYA